MKKISSIFIFLAIVLSNVMCAVVAYNYATMQWGIKYAGFSAPEWTAFLYVIPYGMAIVLCIIVTMVLRKRKANEC